VKETSHLVCNELFPIYRIDYGKTLCEVRITLTTDRPGILAAISNIFADNGINILWVHVNSLRKTMYFIVDLTQCPANIESVLEKIKNLSFVGDISYRIIRGPLLIPSYIRPTFRDKPVVVLDKELLQKVAPSEVKSLVKIACIMGILDAKYIKDSLQGDVMIEDLPELLNVVQLRGLCKVMKTELVDYKSIKVILSECLDEDFVVTYIEGFVRSLFGDLYSIELNVLKNENTVNVNIMFN